MNPDSPFRLIHGESLVELPRLDADSFDSCVTDPPYELGFMGKKWDRTGIAYDPELWRAVWRVLKPGAHLLAFGGTRTHHRMVCAIEDAGFEIRDELDWVYGSGFPKSLNLAIAIARAENPGWQTGDPLPTEAEAWLGFGTALKPAKEPICLARKPLAGTVAANALQHGTGALHIDGCRIGTSDDTQRATFESLGYSGGGKPSINGGHEQGRWPANLCHDGSAEVLARFPQTERARGELTSKPGEIYGGGSGLPAHTGIYGFDDTGSAARFFYCAKASAEDREAGLEEFAQLSAGALTARAEGSTGLDSPRAGAGRTAAGRANHHPTVKPTSIMRWLVRLITPPGGHILDPFNGSGSTGRAALLEGFRYTGIDREAAFIAISRARLIEAIGPLFAPS